MGSTLVAKLAAMDTNHVVVADDLSTGSRGKLPIAQNVTFVKANVNDYDDVAPLFFRFGIEDVFHFAAVVGVKRTLDTPLSVLNDIRGIENILMLRKNTGVQRVYYSSSSEVYGEPFEIPQNEHTTPLNSRLPYAIVKNVGEAFMRTYQHEYGIEYTIFRFFNTYGVQQSEDFVVPRFIRRAMQNQDITVYGDGLQTRTFCYVDDSIDTCLAIHRQRVCVNDTINVGSHVAMTVLDLAKIVIRVVGSRSNIVHLPPLKEGDMTRRLPDNSRMREILGRELVTIEDGICKLVDFYRVHDLISSTPGTT